MGRYIERVENIARLLAVTETFASAEEGPGAWVSILKVFADEAGFADTGKKLEARQVATYFLAREDTPTSIISCLRFVKENARSIRHLLSTETWVQVAAFDARLKELAKSRISLSDLSQICEEIRADCHEHFGVMEATCYRDEVWLFNRIGVALERADQMTRLVDMKYFQIDASVDGEDITPDVAWWNTLLRSASGYHAFRRRHSFNPKADEAAAFILFDEDFPRSVAGALSEAFDCLAELERDYSGPAGGRVSKARDDLASRIKTRPDYLIGNDLHHYIDLIQNDIGALVDALSKRFFAVDPAEMTQIQAQSQS